MVVSNSVYQYTITSLATFTFLSALMSSETEKVESALPLLVTEAKQTEGLEDCEDQEAENSR